MLDPGFQTNTSLFICKNAQLVEIVFQYRLYSLGYLGLFDAYVQHHQYYSLKEM